MLCASAAWACCACSAAVPPWHAVPAPLPRPHPGCRCPPSPCTAPPAASRAPPAAGRGAGGRGVRGTGQHPAACRRLGGATRQQPQTPRRAPAHPGQRAHVAGHPRVLLGHDLQEERKTRPRENAAQVGDAMDVAVGLLHAGRWPLHPRHPPARSPSPGRQQYSRTDSSSCTAELVAARLGHAHVRHLGGAVPAGDGGRGASLRGSGCHRRHGREAVAAGRRCGGGTTAPPPGQQHVGRLDVEMYDALGMQVCSGWRESLEEI